MSWRDDLSLDGDGSFRGVKFRVSSAESTIGRRTVVHEYPGRDEPGFDDMGRRARVFTFAAYVVGDDYMNERNKLIKAFETAGPGELVHPYWGKQRVTVTSPVRIQETTAEGGMCRLSLTVTEAGEDLGLVIKLDTQTVVDTKASAAAVALAETFDEKFSVLGAIESVRDEAVGLVNRATSVINKVTGAIAATMQIANDMAAAVTALSNAAATLILAPLTLANQMQALAQTIMSAASNVSDAVRAILEAVGLAGEAAEDNATSEARRLDFAMRVFRDTFAYGDDESPVIETTPQRVKQAANQAAFIALHKTAFAIEACRAVSQLTPDSYEQALAVRDELTATLDTLADEADDTVYAALVDLRVAFAEHMTSVAESLPGLSEYTPATTLPALVIANQVYGDATRDAEIIARNRIRHPGFVPGGETLELISV